MRLLIIDDSRFSQITISKMLKSILPEIHMDFAGDGEEGWQKYRQSRPDYVFIDLLMPKMDGQTLIKNIKEFDENANIVVISADVQQSVRKELEEYGIKAFFNKPFSLDKAKKVAEIIRDDAQ